MTQATLFGHQLWRLGVCEWKLREQSNLVGLAWTLLHPVLLFSVLYLVFTNLFQHSSPTYAENLIIGLVFFNFFSSGTTYALTSLGRRSGLLLNFTVRREVIVLGAVLSVTFSFLIELALALALLVLLGAKPGLSWLAAPVLALLLVGLVAGASLLLAVLDARFPDIERLWTLSMTALFFLTPVFYSWDMIPPTMPAALRYSPLAILIEAGRGCLVAGRPPEAGTLAGLALLDLAVISAAALVFSRHEPRLSDYVLKR